MKYRAVMFDLDGTLVNTLGDIAAAANHAMSQLDRPTHDNEHYRLLIGRGPHWLIERALGPEHAHLTDRGVQLLRDCYIAHGSVQAQLYDGIAPLLDELGQRGIKSAILTNKPEPAAREVADTLLQRWPFDVVLGQRDDLPIKPDPTGALQITQTLDVPVGQWLYLGDMDVDIQTAHAAGIFAVGAAWGFRSRKELEQASADAVIDHPIEVLELL